MKFEAIGEIEAGIIIDDHKTIKYSFVDVADGQEYELFDFGHNKKEMIEINVQTDVHSGRPYVWVSGSIGHSGGVLCLKLEEWGVIYNGKVYDPISMAEGCRRID